MKVVSIAILRTGPDVAEPIPVSMACELSSYGFFQRQVRTYIIIATEFWGVGIFCSRGILMAESWLCRSERRVVAEGKSTLRGNMRYRALLGLGWPPWYLAARAGSALGFVVRRIFGFQFVHSPTFSDALCGRNPRLERGGSKLVQL